MTRRLSISITIALFALSAGVVRPASAELKATLVASGFANPIAYVAHPTDPARSYVVEFAGRVRTLVNGVVGPDFANLVAQVLPNGGESGMLGMAFAPDYATSGRVYFSFINLSGDSVIARFTRSTVNPQIVDVSTQFNLVWPDGQGGTRASIDQPDGFTNHKGGNIAFGPDGYLYLGLGDGGSANDPQLRAQNPMTLLGKMLRVDVNVPDNDPRGYRLPFDNPFYGSATTLGEIWSFGWRNPWRWMFDYPGPQSTGALVVGDVGQGSWEEVDYEPAQAKGRNYGWRLKEGTFDHVLSLPPAFTPLTNPIVQYPHGTGASVISGPVYRGTALGPFYVGRHFFADFVKGQVWSMGLSVDPLTGDA